MMRNNINRKLNQVLVRDLRNYIRVHYFRARFFSVRDPGKVEIIKRTPDDISFAAARSEIIFGRGKAKKLSDFRESLLDPTIVSPNKEIVLPNAKDLPPNIPPYSMFKVSDKYGVDSLIFPPKPIQEAHEHFLFSSLVEEEKGSDKLLSPKGQFDLYVDRIYKSVSKATCGDDLVRILDESRVAPHPMLTSKAESVRRTLEIFSQLGQIKQFAFLSAPSLDTFILKLIRYCERTVASMSSDQLADTLWSFARLGVRPASVIKKLVAKVESRIGEMDMGQIADIFYSFEELRVDCPKLLSAVEKSVELQSPRSLKELNPTQLFQLSYASFLGILPQYRRRNLILNLCKRVGEVWKTRPYVPIHSMLQICRFTTAVNAFFPGKKFKGLIPNDLREKALYVFKSGRAEMYSPPFLDPMARETITAHYGTMRTRQNPETVGLQGWWLWSFDRRHPPFSLEPSSPLWYTKFDNKKRLLGSYDFRRKIIEKHGLYTLHIPYYEWDLLNTQMARRNYFFRQMEEQLGITSSYRETVTFAHVFGFTTAAKNYKKDNKEIERKNKKIAWDWAELCEINAEEGIDPSRYLNDSNLQVPRAVYNDDERLRKPDYWNE